MIVDANNDNEMMHEKNGKMYVKVYDMCMNLVIMSARMINCKVNVENEICDACKG